MSNIYVLGAGMVGSAMAIDLAKKHHPDKVQHLGEAYIKSAKEKFARIQAAYENIKKQRGIA